MAQKMPAAPPGPSSDRDRVFAEIRDGLSPTAAAEKCGVPRQAVFKWLADGASETADRSRGSVRPDDAVEALRIVRDIRAQLDGLRADLARVRDEEPRARDWWKATDAITRSMAALSQTMVRVVEAHPGLMQLADVSGTDTQARRVEAVNAFLDRQA